MPALHLSVSAILKNIDNDKIIKNSVRDIIIFNIKEIPDSWIEKFLNMNISVLADSDMIKDLYVFLEREIINYANENNIDLVVIGSTGLDAIDRFIIGSTTQYIVNHASCNVMVIK